MAKTSYTCGIDVGTHITRVAVVGYTKEDGSPYTIATGQSPTEGMRLGYVANTDKVAESIKNAVSQAEKTLGAKVKRAIISIGGISLSSVVSSGQAIISRADQEVTHLDVSKAISDSEESLELLNKKIIHIIPISYKLDGKDVHGRPEGMKGVKLEVKTLFVTCLKQNIEDIITAFGLADIEVTDVIATPIASGNILLNNKQRMAGCALLDIGAETVSMAVFENGILISMQVFPIGSMDITKDIALGLRIGLDESESIKLGSVIGGDYPKKKIDEIIEARLGDIFELAENSLKRLRRNELLPAGVVITGGGAHISKIEDIAKRDLKLPCRVGPIDSILSNKLKIRDWSWYTAYGLALSGGSSNKNENIHSQIGDNVKEVKGFFKSLLSQLLP
jgi:cell division protein FtsA